ncbi:hypothetical protein A1Q2_02286 [Trichosporon asahii var. asahii CBS 8904]|uniref:MULE transposase domain-containing protein n=1 Tax=Trichosporon asahii var. asahii (strain CBS 8904) TaxID=1220162 RepID=K1WQS2_TRIAC|nr:hypothetical protein A1Q2_02286 [Trichosporon asahii var. asahii CBS 8904]
MTTDSESADLEAWGTAFEPFEEDEELGGDGFLSEDTDSGLGISRWINEARRRERRKKRYKQPEINGPVPLPYIRHPDVSLHPPPGSPIAEEFPFHQTRTYPDLDSAYHHLNSLALRLGFALNRGPEKRRPNGYHHKVFQCVFGPSRGRGENAQAYAGEKRCTWSITVLNQEDNGWYSVLLTRGKHTHDALDPDGWPAMRRIYQHLNDEWIGYLVELGRPRREIGDRLFIHGVPYEEQALGRLCRKHRDRLRRTEGLLPSVQAQRCPEKSQDISVPWIDSFDGRLQGILFSTKEARALTHRFHRLFMVDVTFGTNFYNLPCLHIVGKTNMDKTFTSAVVLLPNKYETTYRKAIQAWKEHVLLSTVPHLFINDREPGLNNAIRAEFKDVRIHYCQWHIEKNVQRHTSDAGELTKKEITEFLENWKNSVLHCRKRGDLEHGFDKLKDQFFTRTERFGFRGAFHYVHDTLRPDFEQFLTAYVDLQPHLGNRTTSPAEGTHATLKKFLEAKRPKLHDFIVASRKFMNSQYHRSLAMSQHASKPSRGRHELLLQYDSTIARFALNKVQGSIKTLQRGEDGRWRAPNACSRHRQTVFLLPCAHEIAKRLNEGSWSRYEFDSYWHVTTAQAMREIVRKAAAYDPQLARDARTRLNHVDLPPIVLEPTVRPGARLEYRNQRLADRFNSTQPQSQSRMLTGAEISEIAVAERDDDAETLERFQTRLERDNIAAVQVQQQNKRQKQARKRALDPELDIP